MGGKWLKLKKVKIEKSQKWWVQNRKKNEGAWVGGVTPCGPSNCSRTCVSHLYLTSNVLFQPSTINYSILDSFLVFSKLLIKSGLNKFFF